MTEPSEDDLKRAREFFRRRYKRKPGDATLFDLAALITTVRDEASRQAVEELREPTHEMIDAAIAMDGMWSINAIPRLKAAWSAMFSARIRALSSQPSAEDSKP